MAGGRVSAVGAPEGVADGVVAEGPRPSAPAADGGEAVASNQSPADAPSLPATAANLGNVPKGKLYIRQKPGPRNSLGQAKFIFPNAENVYMHGTPALRSPRAARTAVAHGTFLAGNGVITLRPKREWPASST